MRPGRGYTWRKVCSFKHTVKAKMRSGPVPIPSAQQAAELLTVMTPHPADGQAGAVHLAETRGVEALALP